MPEDISKPPVTRGAPQELLDLIPRMPFLPGEDAAAFADLRQGFLVELAPSTPYQTSIAEQLIVLEWEVHRHRSLHEGLLRTSTRKTAQKRWETETRGFLGDGFGVSQEAKEFAEGLLDPTSEHAASSLAWLAERKIEPTEIGAKAYRKVAEALQIHERKLAELEKRRRHLREDYDRLKATRTRFVADAEFVADHDD